MKTNHLLIISAAAAVIALPSCATKREVPYRPVPGAPVTAKVARNDYSRYEKIPDTFTGVFYRTLQSIVPNIRKRAFRANWGGSGRGAGLPVDAMDEFFRRHDIVYAEVRCARTMRWADTACIEALHRLDPKTLAADDIDYRQRATAFFTNPAFNWLGKPAHAFVYNREAKDCPFQTEGDVRELFAMPVKLPAARPAPEQAAQLMAKSSSPGTQRSRAERQIAKRPGDKSKPARSRLASRQSANTESPALQ